MGDNIIENTDKRKKGNNEKKYRDHKNRVLNRGESQRKNGKYRYTYVGNDGKPHSVESWRLVPTDRLPSGKRPCKSLRELEQEIRKELESGVLPTGKNITLIHLIQLQKESESVKKITTLENDDSNIRFIATNDIGNMKIHRISSAYLKEWLKALQSEQGKHYHSIYGYWKVIKKAFKYAEEHDLIMKNPTNFTFSDYVLNDSKPREAVELEDKEAFLEFIKEHKVYSKYYDEIYVLFYTGLRISEFCGLTFDEIDFENNMIILDHQLQYEHGKYYVTSLKGTLTSAEANKRYVPMYKDVASVLQRIIDRRPRIENEMVIQSEDPRVPAKAGFIILSQTKKPKYAKMYERYFKDICNAYNLAHPDKTLKVVPHMCRHTFGTGVAEQGVPIAMLQKMLGHSDIKTTQRYCKTFEAKRIAEMTQKLNNERW